MGKKSTGAKQLEEDFQIQPEKVTPTLDTSNWPLLLKDLSATMLLDQLIHIAQKWDSVKHVLDLLYALILEVHVLPSGTTELVNVLRQKLKDH